MTLNSYSLSIVLLMFGGILATEAAATDSVDEPRATYNAALTKANADRSLKLMAAFQACDAELSASLEAGLTSQDLIESNRIQSLRNQLKLVATEPWAALPSDSSQGVQSVAARAAERKFIAAAKKADASSTSLGQSACKAYIAALDASLHAALKDKKLEAANTAVAAKKAAELQLKLGPGKFPEGALLIVTFDHDTVSTNGKSRALDMSGNGNDLLLGTTKLAVGRIDGGLRATPDLVLHTIHKVGVGAKHARTLSYWLQASSDAGKQVLGWGAEARREQFRVNLVNGELVLWGYGEGNDFITHAKAEPKRWHHHAVTYDGSTLHWLVDGDEIGGGFNFQSATADTPLDVGGFDGVIDEIAIYDRVLTDDEIKQLRTRTLW